MELLFDYKKEKQSAVDALDRKVIDHVLANQNTPLRKLAPLFGLNAYQMQYIVKRSGIALRTGRKSDAQ